MANPSGWIKIFRALGGLLGGFGGDHFFSALQVDCLIAGKVEVRTVFGKEFFPLLSVHY